MELTHFNKHGDAVMVDISDKAITQRKAVATGKIYANTQVMEAINNGANKKGDILGTARIGAIMAAKNTANTIPLCHNIGISKCTVEFEICQSYVVAICTACTTGQTGVEMEALTGASVALLTIYDMCKAVDKAMTITDICLLEKTGGKSGDYIKEQYTK